MKKEIIVLSLERWPNLKEFIGLRKKNLFVVFFGKTECVLSKKILELVLPLIAEMENEKVSIFYILAEETSPILEELGIVVLPSVAIFGEGKLMKVINPVDIHLEEIIKTLKE